MSAKCGLCNYSSIICRRTQTNVALADKEEGSGAAIASSVEWLHSRVDLLLSIGLDKPQPQPDVLPKFVSSRHFDMKRPFILETGNPSPTMSEHEMLKQRERSNMLMMQLLKRLTSATRKLSLASRLISDDLFRRLLPVAISSNYYDMPPACELLLAQTLANLSCHHQAYDVFSSDSFTCNLIENWRQSPSIVLSLSGSKISTNLSNFAFQFSLSPGKEYQPYCIYQPDVFELARPALAAPIIDVIFVNGMLGSVFYTWKQGDQPATSESNSATANRPPEGPASSSDSSDGPQVSDCWPRDWLVDDLPRARILALNMNIRAMKWRGCSANGRDPSGCLPRRASEAADQLLAAGVGRRVTVFVCHSFGGLIVKQMLQLLHTSADHKKKKLLASVCGIVFIAVPHLGRSKVANMSRIYWLPFRHLCLSDEARNVFDGSCRVLGRLHAWFVQYAQTRTNLRVLNIIELSRTPVAPGGFGLKICPESWADKLVGDIVRLPADHIQISKPPSRRHDSYTTVLHFLEGISQYSRCWDPLLVNKASANRTKDKPDSIDGSSICDSTSVDLGNKSVLGSAISSMDSGSTRSSSVRFDPVCVEWHPPMRNFEEELRLRYGVCSARALWSGSTWRRFGALRRPRFYDML